MTKINLNHSIETLPASPTLSLGKLIKDLQKAGKDIINLTVGEPEFATPEPIKQAGINAIQTQDLRYPPTNGILELRRAVAEKLQQDNNLEYSPEDIIIGVGSKHLLSVALQVITNPQDEVLIPIPGWGSYEAQVRLVGAKPVLVKMPAPFVISAQLLEKHLTKQSKVIILNYPSNPTGAVVDATELQKIAQLAVERNLVVIADEIYEHLLFEGKHVSIASLNPQIKERTVTINGVSKAYAMTGWRIGYAAGPGNIVKLMNTVISQTTSGADVIAQHASVQALQLPHEFNAIIAKYVSRFAYFKRECSNIRGLTIYEPKGGLYIWCKIDAQDAQSNAIAEQLVDQFGVAIVPGEAFHTPGYLRIGLGAEDAVFKEGVSRLKKGLQALL